MPSADAPLGGCRVVVTRAEDQAGSLRDRLLRLGADVVEVAVIATADPEDGGAALRAAASSRHGYSWVVLASPNAARRWLAAVAQSATGPGMGGHEEPRLAVVGPGTADAVRAGGAVASLVPARSVGEGLVEAFPRGDGTSRVLLPRAEETRDVIAPGLRTQGWLVDEVVAYRTVSVVPSTESLARARAADVVAFTSSSTVRAFVAASGPEGVPPVVVSIGPATSATAAELGVRVDVTADPHTLDGLVDAVVRATRTRPPGPR